MNTPVNFELAMLLKEKGFDKPSIHYWFENTTVSVPTRAIDYKFIDWNKYPNNLRISAPTIAEVVMWLYEKYGIWIEVKVPDMKGEYWCYSIHKPYRYGSLGNGDLYNSPTEAYEAAIKHCLTNLIK